MRYEPEAAARNVTEVAPNDAAAMVPAPNAGNARRFVTGLGLLAFVGAVVLGVLAATAETLDRELLLWSALAAYLGLRILLKATSPPRTGAGVNSRPFALAVAVAVLLPGILTWYTITDPRRVEHGLDPVLVMWTTLTVWLALLSLRVTWRSQRTPASPGQPSTRPGALRWVMITVFSLAPAATLAWLAWRKEWQGGLVTATVMLAVFGLVVMFAAGGTKPTTVVPPPFQGGLMSDPAPPSADRIGQLANLRAQGLLSDAEFATLAGTSAADRAAPAEDTRGELVLVTVGRFPIKVIKAVRLVTGYGLAEAKALVDAIEHGPVVIAVGLAPERALWGYSELQSAGATAELR